MSFVERLEELRKEKKITRKKLLEDCSLGKNQIAYWENKGTIPTSSVLSTLAHYFNVSVDYLLGKSDIRTEENEQSENFLVFNRNGETIRVELKDQVQSELVDTFLKALLKKDEPEI